MSAYEAVDNSKGHTLHYPWPSNMVARYQQLLEGAVLVTAWQEVPKTAIYGVRDTIRTRVLTMAIDIKNESEQSGMDLTHIKPDSQEAQKIQQSIVTNVYGNLYISAGNQVINTQNIAVGNWEELKNALKASGIGDADVDDLSQAIQQDNKTMGERVKGWIHRHAGKVLDRGLQVAIYFRGMRFARRATS